MRFLVVGCGSIGQRHIRNLKRLGHDVSGCERDPLRIRQVGRKYSIPVFGSLKDALGRRYDGAFICTPTNLHIPQAVEIAKKGIHLFIEKPLSNSLKGIGGLSSIVRKKRLTVLVGCNIRFMPGFKFVKGLIDGNKIGRVLSAKIECGFYLPYWHPYEDYRKGYSAKRSLGGGAIFDDIHELDSLHWLFGRPKEVFCFRERLTGLEIDTEDCAEIFMRFKSKAVAQVHLDYIQRTYRRYYEFIGEKGVIYFDLRKETVELFGEKPNKSRIFQRGIKADPDKMFIDEARHFVNCIKGRERSINGIPAAREVLETALACHRSADKKEIVYL